MERPFFVIWWTSDDVGDFDLDQHLVIKCSKSNQFKKGWFLNISLNMKRHFLWFDEHLVTLMMLIWINMWLQRYIITDMVFYKPIYICHIFVYNVCVIKCFSHIQLGHLLWSNFILQMLPSLHLVYLSWLHVPFPRYSYHIHDFMFSKKSFNVYGFDVDVIVIY